MVACNRASLSSKLLPVSSRDVWTRFAKYGYSLTKDFRIREAVLQGGKVQCSWRLRCHGADTDPFM
jgi:hypothetical protein